MEKKYCPFLHGECMGRECAMAVKIDHPNVSAYNVVWTCGLIAHVEMQKLSKLQIVDMESKYGW